ncbi:serine hydrolase [Halosimplex amylolyticum]|uniref:serine hydrolase n=1 Tax=Halosimplex amylolyticum TaxID=3396616 RepID=UPI003F570A08
MAPDSPSANRGDTGPSADRVEAALARVESWFDDADCPGASVALTDGSEVLAASGFGERTLDPSAPATADTRYAVGSVSKPVTALAVLTLADRDRIDVADPVSAYLSYFEGAPGDPITVAELLSHTSGMPNDDLAFAAGDLDGWDNFRAFVDGTLDRRRTDGDRFLYYNSGYAVLAHLVESVSGTDFASFVEREVFDPLGMDGTTSDSSVLGDPSADVMSPYVTEDGEFREAPVSDNPVLSSDVLRGPGGLIASVTDLARFLQTHLGDGSPFDEDLIRRMRNPAAPRKRLIDGTEYAYGYGWEIRPFGTDALVGHSGNTGASGAYIGFLEDEGIGIAIACNGVADPGGPARDALAFAAGHDPDSVDPVRSIERRVRALTGRYETPSGNHRATVTEDGAHLDVEFGGEVEGFEIRLLPTDLASHCCRFTDVDCVESTTDAEFFTADESVELLFEGMLFRRVGERRGDGPAEA